MLVRMLGMEKKQDELNGKVSTLDAKVSEVLGNQNSHNQTLVDMKTMLSEFLGMLKDHAIILTPSEQNSGCEHQQQSPLCYVLKEENVL